MAWRLSAWGLGLMLMAASPARAQEPAAGPEARLYVLADSVTLGERFSLAVAVTHAGTAAFFPEIPAGDPEEGPLLAFGDAEVFDARRLPPRLEGAARTDSMVYRAATFALDEATVGPVAVRLVVGADTVTVVTGTGAVRVRAELPSMEAALVPPGAPEPFPSPWPLYALLAAGALALVALVVWAVRRFRRRKAAPPRLAPHPEALARLADLDPTPDTPEAVKAYYDALSETLRRYLARTLGLPALEQTTRELTDALAGDDRLEAALPAVRGTLRLSDLVKFADLRPDAEAHAAALARAREAVGAVETAVSEDRGQEAEDGGQKAEDDPGTIPPPPA